MATVEEGDPRLAALAALNEPQRQRLYRHCVAAGHAGAAGTGPPKRWRYRARSLPSTSRSWPSWACSMSSTAALRADPAPGPDGRPSSTGGPDSEIALSVPERQYDIAALLLAEGVEAAADGSVPVADTVRAAARRYGQGDRYAPAPSAGRRSKKKQVEQLTRLLAAHGYEPHRGRRHHHPRRTARSMRWPRSTVRSICAMNLELVRGVVGVGRPRRGGRSADAGSGPLLRVIAPVRGDPESALTMRPGLLKSAIFGFRRPAKREKVP